MEVWWVLDGSGWFWVASGGSRSVLKGSGGFQGAQLVSCILLVVSGWFWWALMGFAGF